jgi:hypothetical protein
MMRALLAAALIVLASALPAGAQVEPRRVFVLWDSSVSVRWRDTFAHVMIEMPLNRLGYIAEPVDVAKPMPDPASFDDAQAVLVWLEADSVPDPAAVMAFLDKAMRRGLRFVQIGDPGFLRARAGGGEVPLAAANAIFSRAGFTMGEEFVRLTFDAETPVRDASMAEFERPLDPGLPPFAIWRPADARTRSYLVVRRRGQPSTESHVIMTGPGGGLAAFGYAFYYEPELKRRQWRIDPFAFLTRALAAGAAPVPDTTTLAGRRIYFSHVDGDGWRNVTEVQPWNRERKLSASVILDEIVAPFPDLPVTIAPIAADLHPDWCGTSQTRAIARRFFALPQVEPGSHTWTHPFDWLFFARPDAIEIERALLSRYPGCGAAPSRFSAIADRVRSRFASSSQRASDIAEFDGQYGAAGSFNTPRAYALKPYSVDGEIADAAAYISSFAPDGKRVRIVQWSGNTQPAQDVLNAAKRAGLHNINGGDTRFDREYDSVSYVAPVGRRMGPEQQIYSGASNENTYTELWTDRFFGFRDLVETFKRTGEPRRLAPVNLYYHVYSGEKPAALQALRDNIAYIRKLEIAPVATSHYAAIAEGFYSARLVRDGEWRWRVENRGALQTLRVDPPLDAAGVDLARSSGVLGFRRDAGALYVALDPDDPAPIVALGADDGAQATLIQSRWPVRGLRRAADGFAFRAAGFGPGEMRWRAQPAARYLLTTDTRVSTEIAANAAGEIAFAVPAADGREVAFSLRQVAP